MGEGVPERQKGLFMSWCTSVAKFLKGWVGFDFFESRGGLGGCWEVGLILVPSPSFYTPHLTLQTKRKRKRKRNQPLNPTFQTQTSPNDSYHLSINARSSFDISPTHIKKRIADASGAKYSIHNEPTVGYKATEVVVSPFSLLSTLHPPFH